MTLFEGNLPQKRQSERERETDRKRKKERKRKNKKERKQASKQERKREREGERVRCQMIWQLQETGHHSLNFSHPFCPFCECAFAWFTPSLMDCRVWSQVIAFRGALSLYSVSCTSLTKNSYNTKVVFNHFKKNGWGLQLFTVPLYKSSLNSWLHSSQVTKYAHLPS